MLYEVITSNCKRGLSARAAVCADRAAAGLRRCTRKSEDTSRRDRNAPAVRREPGRRVDQPVSRRGVLRRE